MLNYCYDNATPILRLEGKEEKKKRGTRGQEATILSSSGDAHLNIHEEIVSVRGQEIMAQGGYILPWLLV